MSEIIFAIPRFHYASYADLYELIRLSNFQTCYIDEIDPQSDNAYIITILNGEIPEGGYPGAKAKIHLWDLEYHLDNPPHIEGVEIWAADKWYAEQIGAKYVPMGSHKGLRDNTGYPADMPYIYAEAKIYDVAYIGFITGLYRREVIRQQLIERGAKLSPLVAWGSERDALLRQSSSYLHVHQHAHIPAVPGLRMVVAAAYSLPVISETCADAGVFMGQLYKRPATMIQRDYNYLAQETEQITRHWDNLTETGKALHRLLCEEYTFRKSVEGAL